MNQISTSLLGNKFYNSARIYSERFGIQVIPLKTCGKTPITPNGLKDGSTEAETLAAWWTQTPQANIGGITGAVSGFFVLDIDPRHDGDDSLRFLEGEHGHLPRTWMALTGGGGQHYFFRHPGFQIGNRAIINACLWMTMNELNELEKNPTASMIEHLVISVIKQGITFGDHRRLGCLLDRLIGKPTERIEHAGFSGGPLQYSHLSDAELRAHCKESMAELQDLLGDDPAA